ncbi:hypothetical protein JCM11641_000361 [Rhodosporidiobolus odoratus]
MQPLLPSYRPFAPSHLSHSSSPQPQPQPHAHPSSDQSTPSSPTTTSFYHSRSRPPPLRTYKPASHSHSSRRSLPSSSPFPPVPSPSTSASSSSLSTTARLHAATLTSSLTSRSKSRLSALAASRQTLEPGQTAPDEPGGWNARGEWEEWTEEEETRLELEMRRGRREEKWRDRLRGEEADELAWAPEAEELGQDGDSEQAVEEEEEGTQPVPFSHLRVSFLFLVLTVSSISLPLSLRSSVPLSLSPACQLSEPPLDILYSPTSDFLSLPSPSDLPPRLPSLVSDPGDSTDTDIDMRDSPGSQGSQSSAKSVHANALLSDEDQQRELEVFDAALLGADCPQCTSSSDGFVVRADGHGGAACAPSGGGQSEAGGGGCGWHIESEVMGFLRRGWVKHGLPTNSHLPLLAHTPFTGTLVLCQKPGCDESFAA